MLDFILLMIAIVIIMLFANLAIRIMILFYPHYSLQLLLVIFIAFAIYNILSNNILSNNDLKHLKLSKKKLIILLTSLIIIFAVLLHHLEAKKNISEHYDIHNMPIITIIHLNSPPDQPFLIETNQKIH